MRSGQITELTLGGFQVFNEPTKIPLGPITLLFGPNSAGKSAIADGLQTLAKFCGFFSPTARKLYTSGEEYMASLLERHWRVVNGESLSSTVTLGLKLMIQRQAWAIGVVEHPHLPHQYFKPAHARFASALAALDPWLRVIEATELEILVELSTSSDRALAIGEPTQGGHRVYMSAALKLGGEHLLNYFSDGRIGVNLAHPALGERHHSKGFHRLTSRFPDDCCLSAGWLSFNIGAELWNTGLGSGSLASIIDMNNPKGSFTEEDHDSCTDFENIFDALWMTTAASVQRIIDVEMVQASRTIPTRTELTYLKSAEGDDIPGSRLGLNTVGCSLYSRLAAGALRTALQNLDSDDDIPRRTDREALEEVNRILADHLFREKGYFVSAEVHSITSFKQGADVQPVNGPTPQDVPYGYLVTLVLGDTEGRRLAFEEVGSGLGYALPVLVALATARVAFIQQPELHLHPALQAELADALISAVRTHAGGSTQLLVETHSEHLLLRLLRRIRQSSSTDSDALDPYLIDQDTVVLLYIDPSSDGSSTVKRIRISKDGEFIDRWPRGFFQERWKELFDE